MPGFELGHLPFGPHVETIPLALIPLHADAWI
jgi:hypothetical protein